MRDGLLLDDVFGKKENRPAVRAAHQLIKCAEDAAPSEREVILAEEIAKNPRRRAALNYESGLPMCAELNAPANRSGDRETIARSMRHDAVRLEYSVAGEYGAPESPAASAKQRSTSARCATLASSRSTWVMIVAVPTFR